MAALAGAIAVAAAGSAAAAPPAHGGLAERVSKVPWDRPSALDASCLEVLSLDDASRAALGRWIRRGGRLSLSGEGAGPAIASLVAEASPPDRTASSILPVGLGAIVVDGSAAPASESRDESVTAGGEELISAALSLARSRLEIGGLHRGPAARLAAYGLLLAIGFLAARSYPARWRVAAGAALAAAATAVPMTVRSAPQRSWAQVDVVADVDDGPPLLWSAAAHRAAFRGDAELRASTPAWNVRVMESSGAMGDRDVETQEAPSSFRLAWRAGRGARAGLGWLAEDEARGGVALDLKVQGGSIRGFVRNGLDRTWTDVWLLLPGGAAVKLDDLPVRSARVIEAPLPAEESAVRRGDDRGSASPAGGGLALRRAQLLDAADRAIVARMLDRGRPVLMAWADGPLAPARVAGGAPVEAGAALLIVAGSMAS